jgi:hypothetical protein
MGQVAKSPQEVQQLEAEDFLKCRNPVCQYYLSPQDVSAVEDQDYFFSCPNCKLTYPLMDPTPFVVQKGQVKGNPAPAHWYDQEPGLGIKNREYETVIGLTMKQQGDIAEGLVQGLKEIPGYGPITWWSETYNDPIDGGCGDWAIEVKAICIDAKNHRFIPGPPKRKGEMIARAQELGFSGIIGMLVILDYRRSVADIYSMEMPLDPWKDQTGRERQGPVAFRKHNGQHLVAEVPFANPFLNPASPEPQTFQHTGDDIPF